MPLPPGTSSLPQVHAAGERRSFYVANRSGNGMLITGPFAATWVPFAGNVTLDRAALVVDIEARVLLPLGAGARPRSILTDALTNVAYEVYDVKTWADQVECFVARSTGDQ